MIGSGAAAGGAGRGPRWVRRVAGAVVAAGLVVVVAAGCAGSGTTSSSGTSQVTASVVGSAPTTAAAPVALSADGVTNGSADADRQFLALLQGGGVSLTGSTDLETATTGRAVCGHWTSGSSVSTQVRDVKRSAPTSDSEAAFLVIAATRVYCPQFLDRLR